MGKLYCIVDDPLYCHNCHACLTRRHYGTTEFYEICTLSLHEGKYGEGIFENVTQYSDSRPDWCPLKQFPNKIIAGSKSVEDYCIGYNECLYDITHDKEYLKY